MSELWSDRSYLAVEVNGTLDNEIAARQLRRYARGKRARREISTLWFPLLLSIPLVLLILFDLSTPARVALGLPFVLFSPGYTLILALYPGKAELDAIERIALSFGLSIAVVPLLGLALNYTSWGIRLYPILVTLIIVTTVMTAIAFYRRSRLLYDDRFFVTFNVETTKWGDLSRLDKILTVVLIGSILFAVGSLCYVVATPKVGEKFTEFYILGPAGRAGDYPREMKIGEEKEVIMGIINHEQRPVSYIAEIRMGETMTQTMGPYELNHEEKMEDRVRFSSGQRQEKMKVEFLLYKDGEGEPYRSLHLWVDLK